MSASAFPTRQVAPLLKQLRGMLAANIEVWAGGAGIERVAAPEGVRIMGSLDAALEGLAQWRAAHPAH